MFLIGWRWRQQTAPSPYTPCYSAKDNPRCSSHGPWCIRQHGRIGRHLEQVKGASSFTMTSTQLLCQHRKPTNESPSRRPRTARSNCGSIALPPGRFMHEIGHGFYTSSHAATKVQSSNGLSAMSHRHCHWCSQMGGGVLPAD